MTSSDAPRFQWRAFASVLLAFASLLLILSGAVLFLAPPGRVANWTGWTLLGLRKGEWTGLHVWFATVFMAATVLHLACNWRALVSYFRDRVTRRLGTRREWLAAGLASAFVLAGTQAALPPFSSLLAWSEHLKESWDRPAERAPIPHAEQLSLVALAEQAGVSLPTAIGRLRAAGYAEVDPSDTVEALATRVGVSAQRIYAIIAAAPATETTTGGGLGWKTLRQFCADERIDWELARARLTAGGIVPDESATLRDLASRSGRKPYDLVALIRAAP